jgi:hypothetical protein
MVAMREAAQECVSANDIKAIVQAQIEKAKKGDKDAMKFVFEQVLGGSAFKGATFTQNHYYGDNDLPDKPTTGRPGSAKKIETMRRRIEAGASPFNSDDAGDDD